MCLFCFSRALRLLPGGFLIQSAKVAHSVVSYVIGTHSVSLIHASLLLMGSLGKGGKGKMRERRQSIDVIPMIETWVFNSGTRITVLNGPILALDNDQGINAVVTYHLMGTAADMFTINKRTGKKHASLLRMP